MKLLRSLSVGIIGSLLAPCVAFAAFSDVSYTVIENEYGSIANAYRRSIQFVEQQGIMTGYPDGTFQPTGNLNRAELMKILVEASGMQDENQSTKCFPDVRDQWFARYVCYAQQRGWVEGYPDGYFHPEWSVSLAEGFKMLVASRGYELQQPQYRGYPVDAWYAPYVETLYYWNILHDAAFNGDRPAMLAEPMTRQRVAEYIYKTYLSPQEKKLSLHLSKEAACTLSDADTFVLEVSTQSSFVSAYTVKGNQRCLISNSFNPFDGISPNDVNYHLKMIDGTGGGSSYGSSFSAPVRNGKVLFEAEGYGHAPRDFFAEGVWEFDVQTNVLRQPSNR